MCNYVLRRGLPGYVALLIIAFGPIGFAQGQSGSTTTSGVSSVPGVSGVRSVPGVPGVSGVQGVPGVRPVPGVSGVRSVPGVPNAGARTIGNTGSVPSATPFPSAQSTFRSQTPVGGGTPQTAGRAQTGPISPPSASQSSPGILNTTGGTTGGINSSPAGSGGGGGFAPSGFVPGALTRQQVAAGLRAENYAQQLPLGVSFVPADNGLSVNTIDPASMFYLSGLRQNDVIISLFGQPVSNETDLARIAGLYGEQPMQAVVMRGGEQQTLDIRLPRQLPAGTSGFNVPEGVTFADGEPYLGAKFNPTILDAAVVISVDRGSPAEMSGLRPGDAITGINGTPIRSPRDVAQLVHAMRPGEGLDIAFSRRVENQTRVSLAAAPFSKQPANELPTPPQAGAAPTNEPPATSAPPTLPAKE